MPEQSLTKEQLSDVLAFSQALYLTETTGAFSPWLSNELLRNLNNNARVPTLNAIKKALKDYKNQEKNLQGFNEFMMNYDMIFKRTLYSYANVLAFDLNVVCTNAFTQSDYESPAYQEDKRRIYEFLDKFDYKKEFKNVVIEVLRRETYYTWFRKTKWGNKGMKFALQIMPQDYCMLTGYWEKGLLWDLDYNYFLQAGVDIEGFDPSIIKTFNKMFGPGAHPLNYNPTAPLNERTGEYAYWAQTSPMDGAWCFKLNTSNFTSVPFLSPFLKDSILNDEIAQLQYNKDMLAAYAILAGEIRLFETKQSGNKANQFAIDPATLGGFMAKAKNGLGELVKLAALPVENSKFYQFTDNNTNMYSDQLANSAGVGSGISRVIYSSDRQAAAEIEAGITDQYNTMKSMYSQFENFMDFYGNQLTKHYKFKFIFDGCSYKFEREQRFDRLMKIADKGLVLNPGAFASVMGYRPQDFERMLQESKWGGWNQLWQLPLNSNTQSADSGEVGRPQSDDDDLSESGEMNRNM